MLRILPIVLLCGCESFASSQPLDGSLAAIKEEQRLRLYNRCMQEHQDAIYYFPLMSFDIATTCRQWGRERVP